MYIADCSLNRCRATTTSTNTRTYITGASLRNLTTTVATTTSKLPCQPDTGKPRSKPNGHNGQANSKASLIASVSASTAGRTNTATSSSARRPIFLSTTRTRRQLQLHKRRSSTTSTLSIGRQRILHHCTRNRSADNVTTTLNTRHDAVTACRQHTYTGLRTGDHTRTV